MPDLATHLLTSFLPPASRQRRLFLLGGVIWPDLLGRSLTLLFPGNYTLYWISTLLHTPLLLLLSTYLLSLITRRNKVEFFFSWLGGVGLHLAADALQRHYRPAYFWLFPFSFRSAEIPLFWPEESVFFIPLLLLFLLLLNYYRKKRK